jgi:hypothetical protein
LILGKGRCIGIVELTLQSINGGMSDFQVNIRGIGFHGLINKMIEGIHFFDDLENLRGLEIRKHWV